MEEGGKKEETVKERTIEGGRGRRGGRKGMTNSEENRQISGAEKWSLIICKLNKRPQKKGRQTAPVLVTGPDPRTTKIHSSVGICGRELWRCPCLLPAGASAHGPANRTAPNPHMPLTTTTPKCTRVGLGLGLWAQCCAAGSAKPKHCRKAYGERGNSGHNTSSPTHKLEPRMCLHLQ